MKKTINSEDNHGADLLARINQRCYPITCKMSEQLQKTLKQLLTYEGRTHFLKEIYTSLSRLEEHITNLQELVLQEKEGQRLIYHYIAIAQDIRSAILQLRYALRLSLSSKVDVQIAILHALNRKLLHAINGSHEF
ncbi:hypothetical protein [Aneurinibacillus tyrosinisolvens]|uniref:hypothetical protein n=1 Tax=Aneurinibacillus tyrosinisolvens TaxID=1443435 RepID=UPI00063FB4E4|nr:hypothetical protein [Aneurinibacillus tyrosinisolvens]